MMKIVIQFILSALVLCFSAGFSPAGAQPVPPDVNAMVRGPALALPAPPPLESASANATSFECGTPIVAKKLVLSVPLGYVRDLCAPPGRTIKSLYTYAFGRGWELQVPTAMDPRLYVTPYKKAKPSNIVVIFDNESRTEITLIPVLTERHVLGSSKAAYRALMLETSKQLILAKQQIGLTDAQLSSPPVKP